MLPPCLVGWVLVSLPVVNAIHLPGLLGMFTASACSDILPWVFRSLRGNQVYLEFPFHLLLCNGLSLGLSI